MAFGGYCGFNIDLSVIKHITSVNIIEILFAEECGWILEVDEEHVNDVLLEINVPVYHIGSTSLYGSMSQVRLHTNCLIVRFCNYCDKNK